MLYTYQFLIPKLWLQLKVSNIWASFFEPLFPTCPYNLLITYFLQKYFRGGRDHTQQSLLLSLHSGELRRPEVVLGIKLRSAVQSTCLTHICWGGGGARVRLLRGTPEYSRLLAVLGNGAHLISVLEEYMGSGV